MRFLSLVRHTFALAALSGSITAASAQNAFYTMGTYTIDAAHSITGTAFVGLSSSFSRTDSMGNLYNPTVNVVAGGSVGTALGAYNSSHVNVSGGFVASLVASDTNQINISGGTLGSLNAFDSSQVILSGGTVGKSNGINYFDQTIGGFTLIGNNLLATNIGADPFNGNTDYALSGTLLGGTNLSGYVLNVSAGSTFTLQNVTSVPEPSSSAFLLGLVAVGSARRKRAVVWRRG